jgi:hypothetical protein
MKEKTQYPQRLFHKIPPKAIQALADTMTYGAEKRGQDPWSMELTGENHWRSEHYLFHVDKAFGHLLKLFSGSTEEDHLLGAFCRLAQAIDTREDTP